MTLAPRWRRENLLHFFYGFGTSPTWRRSNPSTSGLRKRGSRGRQSPLCAQRESPVLNGTTAVKPSSYRSASRDGPSDLNGPGRHRACRPASPSSLSLECCAPLLILLSLDFASGETLVEDSSRIFLPRLRRRACRAGAHRSDDEQGNQDPKGGHHQPTPPTHSVPVPNTVTSSAPVTHLQLGRQSPKTLRGHDDR